MANANQLFLKCLYLLAIYSLLLETWTTFYQDSVHQIFALQATGISLWLETYAIYAGLIYFTCLALKYLSKACLLVLFFFKPSIREKVKERVRQRLEQKKLQQKEKSSDKTNPAYLILFIGFAAANGAIFNRAEGTPLVAGAVAHFTALFSTHLPIYLVELVAFLAVFIGIFVLAVLVRVVRGPKTPDTEASTLESGGQMAEVTDKKRVVYEYLESSIIDEKLVDVDAVEPVTYTAIPQQAPVDLL
ncbi:hypothetical protein C8J56DRAFT_916546 [Mycena floridula]|nr:hypothetical protein C8J56DRAFT_916546 [Mycena floridula]